MSAVIILVVISIVPSVAYIYSSSNTFSYATIVLDAGHGGIDGGVVGLNGEKESDINLDIVLRLKKKLEKQNFNVILTRESSSSFSDIKIEDMKKRKEIIIAANADAVISIHVNRCQYKSRRGVQVFYDDSGIGEEFGKIMQSTMNTYINSQYSGRNDLEALSGNFYITKCALVPSIIIECGFMSNVEDEKLLLTDEYRNQIVDKISIVMSSLFV